MQRVYILVCGSIHHSSDDKEPGGTRGRVESREGEETRDVPPPSATVGQPRPPFSHQGPSPRRANDEPRDLNSVASVVHSCLVVRLRVAAVLLCGVLCPLASTCLCGGLLCVEGLLLMEAAIFLVSCMCWAFQKQPVEVAWLFVTVHYVLSGVCPASDFLIDLLCLLAVLMAGVLQDLLIVLFCTVSTLSLCSLIVLC